MWKLFSRLDSYADLMKNRIEIRNVLAITLIIASFATAFALALISNSRASYWVATRNLTPGHMVDATDFKVVKANLAKEALGYILASENPVGLSISRSISAGEYLNRNSLVESFGESQAKLLSFAVAIPDLPAGLRIGDAINLYQVINENGDGSVVPSELVIEDVFIVDLNLRSENIGGAAIVTVAIPNDYVERALNATRKGRMVIVANHG